MITARNPEFFTHLNVAEFYLKNISVFLRNQQKVILVTRSALKSDSWYDNERIRAPLLTNHTYTHMFPLSSGIIYFGGEDKIPQRLFFSSFLIEALLSSILAYLVFLNNIYLC